MGPRTPTIDVKETRQPAPRPVTAHPALVIDDGDAALLRRRVRIGAMLIAVGIAVSAASDLAFRQGPQPILGAMQAMQLLALFVLRVFVRWYPAWTRGIAVGGLSFVCVSAAATGIVTDDDTTLPLLLSPLLMGSATLLPWDARAQAVVALFAMFAVLGNLHFVSGEVTLTQVYPMLVASGLTFAASIYIASRLQQARARADVTERARREAEQALRIAHDVLEQRVSERTEQLSVANAALRAEMAERARIEEAARLHQLELAHVSRIATMGQMAAEMAHELNQPLAAIGGYSQGCVRRLRSTDASAAQILPAVEGIAAQALRAGEILRRMTAFARKRSSRYATQDIRHLIATVCGSLESDWARERVALRLDLAAIPLPVRMDALEIEQVMVNLARNALDAMKARGAGERELCIETSPVEPFSVEVRVSDSGEGIAAESVERVFDPFFTTKPDGLGLGLSVSRSIVEAHGGRIWVSARGPSGTTFHFTLPLQPSDGLGLEVGAER